MDSYGSPSSRSSSFKSASFARNAANISLLCSLLLVWLAFLLPLLHKYFVNFSPSLGLVLGVATILLFVIGVIAGVLAIISSTPENRGVVLIRASLGLALLALIGLIAVPGYFRARTEALRRAEALKGVRSATEQLHNRAVANLTGSSNQPIDLNQLQHTLDQAAHKTSGQVSEAMGIARDYVAQLQSHQHAYQTASHQLIQAKVLAPASLQRREDIAERKTVVSNFLDSNAAFRDFIAQSEANYRKALSNARISQSQREAALKGFKSSFEPQLPDILEIRGTDERLGNSMLTVLTLLETNWGHWRYDSNASMIRFENRAAINQYNEAMAAIRQARLDQAAAQKRLASVMTNVSKF